MTGARVRITRIVPKIRRTTGFRGGTTLEMFRKENEKVIPSCRDVFREGREKQTVQKGKIRPTSLVPCVGSSPFLWKFRSDGLPGRNLRGLFSLDLADCVSLHGPYVVGGQSK